MALIMMQIKIKEMTQKYIKKYFNLRRNLKMKIKKLVNNNHKSSNIMVLTLLIILGKHKTNKSAVF